MGDTIYSPPEHQDKIIRKTKREASDREEHFDRKQTEKLSSVDHFILVFLKKRVSTGESNYFLPSGFVRYCIIRSITRGFRGKLIWQYWSGEGRWFSPSRDADRISSDIPGSTDSLCATTPSPSKVARYLPSSAISQVFPSNHGKNPGTSFGLVVTIIRYVISDRNPAVRRLCITSLPGRTS
jgi:hypothetical protein